MVPPVLELVPVLVPPSKKSIKYQIDIIDIDEDEKYSNNTLYFFPFIIIIIIIAKHPKNNIYSKKYTAAWIFKLNL